MSWDHCITHHSGAKQRLKEKNQSSFKKGLDKSEENVYNIECRRFHATADRDEYTEKYSRGRRGAPAKGVGRLYRRESSNLSFSAIQVHNSDVVDLFLVSRKPRHSGGVPCRLCRSAENKQKVSAECSRAKGSLREGAGTVGD